MTYTPRLPAHRMKSLITASALLWLTACSHNMTTFTTSSTKPVDKQTSTTVDPILAGLSPQEIASAEKLAWQQYHRGWSTVGARSVLVRDRITTILKQMQAPLSLQLLPVTESTYNPYALSSAGATGLWQLMPRTARVLGIKSNPAIDGRRSVETSTRTAVHYLLQLHQRFNNWPLAFAAYNFGPYALEKRLKDRPWKPEDGLASMPVPGSTRLYIQHIIGLIALNDSRKLLFPEPVKTLAVELHAPVDLKRLATLSGRSEAYLFQYNPGLRQNQYEKLLPISIHVPAVDYEQLMLHKEHAAPEFILYKIKQGDTLWQIARTTHCPVALLKRLNPRYARTLSIGRMLKIPAGKHDLDTVSKNPLVPDRKHVRYTVRSGDSLWNIARRFGTTTKAIERYNGLNRNATIREGDTLLIHSASRSS